MGAIAKVRKMVEPVIDRFTGGKALQVVNENNRKVWDDTVTIKPVDGKVNNKWALTQRGTNITTRKKPLINSNAKVFAMGSCFAVEIRSALRQKGFEVLPRYFDIQFDPEQQVAAKLPDHDNINHYNTFSILQEFKRAFGREKTDPNDFWDVNSATIKSSVGLSTKELYQDPLRKRIFAGSVEALQDISGKLDDCIREGMAEADVYVITLGLTEVWRNKKTGKYICMAPGRAQIRDCEFIATDFQSNLENIREVCSLIQEYRPEKPVILTVSPVGLERTFTDKDIVVANMESKSILRSVAGQIEREFDNVTYWPSYEIAMREDMYEEDGRHVLRGGVHKIVSSFIATHCEGAEG